MLQCGEQIKVIDRPPREAKRNRGAGYGEVGINSHTSNASLATHRMLGAREVGGVDDHNH
jgi:hypothetical protein